MQELGKILLVANNFPPVRGGSSAVYDSLARLSNMQVIVVAPFLNYVDGLPLIGWREHDRRASYRVLRLPLLRTKVNLAPRRGRLGNCLFLASDLSIRVRVLYNIFRLMLNKKIRTLCIGELLASGWMINLFRYIPGIRTVIYVHGEEVTTQDSYDPEHRRARSVLRAADKIIVVSCFTYRAVRDLVGKPFEGKINLIGNGVDTSRFCPRPRRTDLIDRYRLRDCFVFISVCRLVEKKGIDNAIRAFATVARQDKQCRYLVVGTGPYRARLQMIAAELGVADKVVFAGQVLEEDLVDHYCLGHAFVMPNRALDNGDTEGFGLVFLEANSCGLPVIAGRDGGSVDAVQDRVNGLVVDGVSVAEIEAAMLTLRNDATLYTRIHQRGLDIAASADWRSKVRQFLDVCVGRC